tara:strand:- start:2192 stop:2506 length:315 start_codon:yes stop_codon:yes gene_type:complete
MEFKTLPDPSRRLETKRYFAEKFKKFQGKSYMTADESDEASKAFDAIQKAYVANPNASRRALKRQAYRFLIPGIGGLFLQIFLSAAIKIALEWLLGEMFSDKGK